MTAPEEISFTEYACMQQRILQRIACALEAIRDELKEITSVVKKEY